MIDISIGFRSLLGGEKPDIMLLNITGICMIRWNVRDAGLNTRLMRISFEETIQLFWGFQIITSIWSFYASPVTHSDLNSDRVQNTKMRCLNINWQWLLDRVLVVAITPNLIPILRDFSLLANLPLFTMRVFSREEQFKRQHYISKNVIIFSGFVTTIFLFFFLFIKTLVYKQLFYLASNIHLNC